MTHQSASPHGRVQNPVTQNQIVSRSFGRASVSGHLGHAQGGGHGGSRFGRNTPPSTPGDASLPLCSWQRVGSSAPHSRVSTCVWSARRGAAVCRAAAHARGAFGCCGIGGGAGAGCSPCWRRRGSCCTTTLSCPGAQAVGCCRCSCWGSPARLGRQCSRT